MWRLEEEVAVARSRARKERINLEARVEEVEESTVGEKERAVVRVKVLEERKARLEESVGVAEEEERVVVLENTLAEVEKEKGALQLRLVDLKEVTASEVRLKVRVRVAEVSRRLGDELGSRHRSNGAGRGRGGGPAGGARLPGHGNPPAGGRGARQVAARGQGLSGTSCTSTSHTSFTVKASLPPPPAHYARGKALAIFPDMARGNLLQIKAAGEGYSKFTLRGRILWESPRKKKKKCELNL